VSTPQLYSASGSERSWSHSCTAAPAVANQALRQWWSTSRNACLPWKDATGFAGAADSAAAGAAAAPGSCQSRMAASSPTLTACRPSGAHAMPRTARVWPRSVATARRAGRSQSSTSPSAAPERRQPPARGLRARQVSPSAWPPNAHKKGLANVLPSFTAATARVYSVARCSGCSAGSRLRCTLARSLTRSRVHSSSEREMVLMRMRPPTARKRDRQRAVNDGSHTPCAGRRAPQHGSAHAAGERRVEALKQRSRACSLYTVRNRTSRSNVTEVRRARGRWKNYCYTNMPKMQMVAQKVVSVLAQQGEHAGCAPLF